VSISANKDKKSQFMLQSHENMRTRRIWTLWITHSSNYELIKLWTHQITNSSNGWTCRTTTCRIMNSLNSNLAYNLILRGRVRLGSMSSFVCSFVCLTGSFVQWVVVWRVCSFDEFIHLASSYLMSSRIPIITLYRKKSFSERFWWRLCFSSQSIQCWIALQCRQFCYRKPVCQSSFWKI